MKPEGALPVLRDVLETHRLEIEVQNGVIADDLASWFAQSRVVRRGEYVQTQVPTINLLPEQKLIQHDPVIGHKTSLPGF